MKFLALIFAILAFVPRALQWMVGFLAQKMGDCTLPAEKCLINDNDQAELLNMLYAPNWFSTTGTWIGLAGFVVFFSGMLIMNFINERKTQKMIDKGVQGPKGGGVVDHKGRHFQSRSEDDYGKMPRPPAFDRYGRPRK